VQQWVARRLPRYVVKKDGLTPVDTFVIAEVDARTALDAGPASIAQTSTGSSDNLLLDGIGNQFEAVCVMEPTTAAEPEQIGTLVTGEKDCGTTPVSAVILRVRQTRLGRRVPMAYIVL
jgi:hypothetical protein